MGISLSKSLSKIAIGVALLFFLADFQPVLSIPPVKKSTAFALEQSQAVESKSLPFVFKLPHPGYLSTKFYSYHPGIDIATGLGMPIHPIAPGVVVSTGFNFFGLGLNVVVEHAQGYKSLYAHMGKIYVKEGQIVSEDDYLGTVGMTGQTSGPHTHLELTKNGEYIDPQTVLPEIGETAAPEYLTPIQPEAKKEIKQTVNDALDIKQELKENL